MEEQTLLSRVVICALPQRQSNHEISIMIQQKQNVSGSELLQIILLACVCEGSNLGGGGGTLWNRLLAQKLCHGWAVGTAPCKLRITDILLNLLMQQESSSYLLPFSAYCECLLYLLWNTPGILLTTTGEMTDVWNSNTSVLDLAATCGHGSSLDNE